MVNIDHPEEIYAARPTSPVLAFFPPLLRTLNNRQLVARQSFSFESTCKVFVTTNSSEPVASRQTSPDVTSPTHKSVMELVAEAKSMSTSAELEKLFELLEEYAPVWYTEEHHHLAVDALVQSGRLASREPSIIAPYGLSHGGYGRR